MQGHQHQQQQPQQWGTELHDLTDRSDLWGALDSEDEEWLKIHRKNGAKLKWLHSTQTSQATTSTTTTTTTTTTSTTTPSSWWCFWKKDSHLGDVWRISLHDQISNHQLFGHKSNRTRTTKYTFINFVPKNLFEQFHRLANVYFFVISCLQMFTDLSPTGKITTIVPLAIVMGFTALKDAFEDWQRYKSDIEVNGRWVDVLSSTDQSVGWNPKLWKNVCVGDIVQIHNNQYFPADLVLVGSTSPNGICFVETSNIDGETNLKMKQAHPETASYCSIPAMYEIRGTVCCNPPNSIVSGNLSFQGTLETPGERGGTFTQHSLSHKQLLLRGSQLRNTKRITGVVVYVGSETKVMLNAKKPKHKVSTLERLINRCLLISFATLSLMCVIGAILHQSAQSTVDKSWYLYTPSTDHWVGVWVTYLLLLNNMIPLSLYVTLELCKMIQAQYIRWDNTMFDPSTKQNAQARTSSLNEELGQIHFIFCDKTGTLTQNQMIFRSASVAGKIANLESSENGENVVPILRDAIIRESGKPFAATPDLVVDFVATCCLCHSIVPEKIGSTIEYQASSPDEKALVLLAESCGIRLLSRGYHDLRLLNVHSNEEMFVEVLHTLEFTADRKRMSVICKINKNRIVLLCKGADSVIYPRVSEASQHDLGPTTQHHLDSFATTGLRTLVLARRDLDVQSYQIWAQRYATAAVGVDASRESQMESLASEIEVELELLGATAIEDKLQYGVPSTISVLQTAGIRMWMLTGDKEQTAVNIGHSCGLLCADATILHIVCSSFENDQIARDSAFESLKNAFSSYKSAVEAKRANYALLIGGDTLRIVFESATMRTLFLRLSTRMFTVICYRVSPMQKAQVALLVRKNLNKVTLAIGDGANDVPMIIAAHVGVGIIGNEGMQAVQASDYSIGQFRFLRSLLLAHGHWSYRRVSHIALYCFYKSSVLFMTQFWFSVFNLWSGQSLFERWTQAAYNLFFSSMPIIAYGCLDRDVSAKTLLRLPQLYRNSQQGNSFSYTIYSLWLVRGLYHSVICFLVPAAVFNIRWKQSGVISPDGLDRGLFVMGFYTYSSVVVVVTLRMMLTQRAHTWINMLFNIGSVAMWFVYNIVYSRIDWNFFVAYHLLDRSCDHALFWLCVPVTVAIAFLPDVVVASYARVFSPQAEDVALEIEKNNMFGVLRAQHTLAQADTTD